MTGPTTEPTLPAPATIEQLRDYCEWHIQMGRGKHLAAIDPRGLAYLTDKRDVRLALPLVGEGEHDHKRVFIRAVF